MTPYSRDPSHIAVPAAKGDLTGYCPGPSLCPASPGVSRTAEPGLPSIRCRRSLQAEGHGPGMVPRPDGGRALEGTVNVLTHAVHQRSELRQPPAHGECHMERKGIQAQQPLRRENWKQRVSLPLRRGKDVTTDHCLCPCPLPQQLLPLSWARQAVQPPPLCRGLSEAVDRARLGNKQHS